MADQLSTEADYSIDEESVPDVVSALQRWDVPDGAKIILYSGRVATGDFTTTADNSGPAGASAEPSTSTRLGLAVREPNDPLDAWTVITEEIPIGPFNKLTLKDQQSSENAQSRRVRFDPEEVTGGSLTAEDADEIALVALSPDAIDGAASQFSIEVEFENN